MAPDDLVDRIMVAIHRRPFGRIEGAVYEYLSAAAVRAVTLPYAAGALARAGPGPLLDVGCGGGGLTQELARAHDGPVVGIDPSRTQLARARRRHRVPLARAAAGGLPFGDGCLAGLVTSCTIKHWPDAEAGLGECARVLREGAPLVLVEIDGNGPRSEMRAFVRRTRIPPGLRWVFPGFARVTFRPVSPPAAQVAATLTWLGFHDVAHTRIPGLPFYVVTATR